ncbi:hypothetical protein HUB95_00340 [Wolbachia endosymbiont of Ceratosolen solmsi]|uniref:hypothetical protein n=1 Tax=Wolbachia endosymbiont of Ceratosolen solmsi TaxID=497299 RepID=UPI001AEAC1F9|nr:hypothetical protein [Wolbachia endosymbiont of Ceratosolen solmsi]QTP62549.1 hypothetical protein HUB95_00340 [Wolbachia endosymbiont of Ceratosolen solmsi]
MLNVMACFASNTKVSSQCLTLGSRYKNICKLCNGQQILGAYIKLISIIKIRWIPVSRTGMTKRGLDKRVDK